MEDVKYQGKLNIGKVEIECYVLESGTRVLSRRGIQKCFGFSSGDSGDALPKLLKNNDFVEKVSPEKSGVLSNHLEFKRQGAGGSAPKTFGYEAETLIDIASIFSKASEQGILPEKFSLQLQMSNMILRAFAKVGINAVIDEATGFQYDRKYDALRVLLDRYIEEEARKWIKEFPDDFFKQLDRLYNNNETTSRNRPIYYGKFINTYIYNPLESGKVLKGLNKVNPKNEKGQRKNRQHQHLSSDLGLQQMRLQMGKVMSLMEISDNMNQFKSAFVRLTQPNLFPIENS
jgi:hypothetical protein